MQLWVLMLYYLALLLYKGPGCVGAARGGESPIAAGRDCVSENSGIETKRGAAGRRQNFSLRESDRKRGRAALHQTEKGAYRRPLDIQETAEGDMKVDT